MEIGSLVRHECHDGDSQGLLLFLVGLLFCLDWRGRRHIWGWGWRKFLMARTLTELPSQEDEEDEEQDEGRRNLSR